MTHTGFQRIRIPDLDVIYNPETQTFTGNAENAEALEKAASLRHEPGTHEHPQDYVRDVLRYSDFPWQPLELMPHKWPPPLPDGAID
jgi:hypothetical protein